MPALCGLGALLMFLGCPCNLLQAHGPGARCQSQLGRPMSTLADPGELLMPHADVVFVPSSKLRLRAGVFVPPEVEALVKTL